MARDMTPMTSDSRAAATTSLVTMLSWLVSVTLAYMTGTSVRWQPAADPCGVSTLVVFGAVSPGFWLVGSENLVAGQHASGDVVGDVAVELPDPGVVGDHVGHHHARG